MISIKDFEREQKEAEAQQQVWATPIARRSPRLQAFKRKSSEEGDGVDSLFQPVRIVYYWMPTVENLISFHFSLLPFFDSKTESDDFLAAKVSTTGDSQAIDGKVISPGVTMAIKEDVWRVKQMDSVFVKVIFPFIERRIEEEGVWRKSANFSRIKKIQKELVILTQPSMPNPQIKESKKEKKSTLKNIASIGSINQSKTSIMSFKSKKSTSSMSSLASSSSLSASRSSLDDIDDDENCEYSVHDMTTLVKRILLPAFAESQAIQGFLSLLDFLSIRIPSELLDLEDVSKVREFQDGRLYMNLVSVLSLYLLNHQKKGHDVFVGRLDTEFDRVEGDSTDDEESNNFMSLFVSLFDLLKYTSAHSVSNKMPASNLATLFTPLLYPTVHDSVQSSNDLKESDKSRRIHFILSFIIYNWSAIRSAGALPKTFLTDFDKLQEKERKKRNRKKVVGRSQTFKSATEDEDEVMTTCVRFCATPAMAGPSTAATTGAKTPVASMTDTELELARLYAHVQSTADKKMIKKLNRAGVVIPPSTGKKAKPSETPAKTPSKKLPSIRGLFLSSKKKSVKSSPSSYDLNVSGSASSKSFEVLRFN